MGVWVKGETHISPTDEKVSLALRCVALDRAHMRKGDVARVDVNRGPHCRDARFICTVRHVPQERGRDVQCGQRGERLERGRECATARDGRSG
jgi:hypothetical protein